jgi:allantoinase
MMEEGGFLCDRDRYADELPYYVIGEGRSHWVVPYTLARDLVCQADMQGRLR